MNTYQITYTLMNHSDSRNSGQVTSTKSGNTAVVQARDPGTARQIVESQFGGRSNVNITGIKSF